jgi:Cu(I)/Ag(I) efflux system periplasmic protein CusF
VGLILVFPFFTIGTTMNATTRSLKIGVAAFGALCSLSAYAVSSLPLTDGEIRKIDASVNKITIKHGDIKNLEMPGMTMVFQIKDPAMLNRVKVGDKVRFVAEKLGGAFVVTEIQVAK